MKISLGLFCLFLVCLSALSSCYNNKFDVDTSNSKVDIKINRLDIDLIANYPDTPDVKNLSEKYGDFFELYSKMVIGAPDEQNLEVFLIDFNKYCKNYNIPSLVEAKFGDLSKLQSSLNSALSYYKYYFPEKKTPAVYTFLSGFQMSVVTDEGILGIGLDKYLGSNCDLYASQAIDKYKSRRMEPIMVPVDCMRALATSEFPGPDSANNMLNNIVYEGKIQFFLDAMLPFESDTVKFGYTKDQLEWAQHNEDKMWAYVVENQLLFSTDELAIRKMVGDSPFTSFFANNSAPRAGAFLGLKIVQNYMDNNPKIDLKQLMLNNDFQGILNSAEYKP